MLVYDIRTHRDMIGYGDTHLIGAVEYAVLPVGEFLGMRLHISGQTLPIAVIFGSTCPNGFVHPPAGFFPHAKAAVFNGGRNMFGSASQISQLKIVNGTGTVGCQMGDIAVFHQPDQIPGQTAFDYMGTDKTGNGPAFCFCRFQLLYKDIKFLTLKQVVLLCAGSTQIIDSYKVVAVLWGKGLNLGKVNGFWLKHSPALQSISALYNLILHAAQCANNR